MNKKNVCPIQRHQVLVAKLAHTFCTCMRGNNSMPAGSRSLKGKLEDLGLRIKNNNIVMIKQCLR